MIPARRSSRARHPVLVWLALAACSSAPPRSLSPATTSGAIAIANLDHLISERVADPAVVELLLTRARFLGDTAALDRAVALAEPSAREPRVASGGDAAPEREVARAHSMATAAALVRRAQARGAVHRFREALTDLAAASRAGADVTLARAAILVATGRAAETLPALEAEARRRPGYASNAALAGAYAALGRFADADARYASARAALDTTSPLPYAWLDFARGLMWSEQAGDPSRGAAYYAAALARMPQLTVAALHLAELEAARGDLALAFARLAPIARRDPSALALLGELHVRSGRPILGFIELTRARAQLEALVARHPLAFADHAAEVHLFSGGDPTRAWSLATQNLDNRATLRAWRLAATAARATNRPLAPLLARPPRSW